MRVKTRLTQWAKGFLRSRDSERMRILAECAKALVATFAKTRTIRAIPVGDIERTLRGLGIEKGDVVLFHSATDVLASAGSSPTSGSFNLMTYAREILDMIMTLVGTEGTIMMPTAPMVSADVMSAERQVFDYRKTLAGTGLIPNRFLKREGVVRSFYPWQNSAVWGRQSEALMGDHLKACPYAMNPFSPWYRLNELGGKVILLGVDHARSSTVHVVENTYPQEYPRPVFFGKPHRFLYISPSQNIECVEMYLHAVRWQDGAINNFCEYIGEKYGIYRRAQLHNTQVISFNAKDQFDAFLKEMKNDVCLFDARFWGDNKR